MLEFERKQRILAETVTQSPLYQQLARKKHRTREEPGGSESVAGRDGD
jgi:hypothetical protein